MKFEEELISLSRTSKQVHSPKAELLTSSAGRRLVIASSYFRNTFDGSSIRARRYKFIKRSGLSEKFLTCLMDERRRFDGYPMTMPMLEGV
ncbi:hypothetical protein PGTUg99_033073 [Puccinia graminis f. sp. tritici]|uniref:Uncharacterized protein n=1 Tax=Puccinia graminis f. sp. tritici TaxID=56615 RepID=A0A5B0NLS6_PUCGR|nr:hypothetical protein PGTUg99_033073 [Puccinia graminis f. sp. tritici]